MAEQKVSEAIVVADIDDVFTFRVKSARYLAVAAPNDDPVGVLPVPYLLPRLSRYKTTLVYTDLNQSFGRWAIKPEDLPADPSDDYHVVQDNERYRLDLVSYNRYSTASLWWVIALVNNIRNTFVKPEVADLLRIPNIDRVLSILT
jgi:hypothetical protein